MFISAVTSFSRCTILSFLLCISIVIGATCQVSVLACGGDGRNERGSVSFSIGQVADEHYSAKSGFINEGVQQPFEIFNIIIGTQVVDGVEFSVHPNPFQDWIVIECTETMGVSFDYLLLDITGRVYARGIIDHSSQLLSLSELQPSMYLLMLTKRAQLISSIKIVKTE